jgi:FlaG/FlaF family flagellin (archaellin)
VTDRAVSPLVGSLALVGVTLVLALVVGVTVTAPVDNGPGPRVRVDVAVDATADRIVLEHLGGSSIDVRDLRVVVSVEGESLDRQPPIPFFAANGFVSGPTGPFNSATDPNWTAGERASFAVAGTNAPSIETNDEVRVRLYVAGDLVADLRVAADEHLSSNGHAPVENPSRNGHAPVENPSIDPTPGLVRRS